MTEAINELNKSILIQSNLLKKNNSIIMSHKTNYKPLIRRSLINENIIIQSKIKEFELAIEILKREEFKP